MWAGPNWSGPGIGSVGRRRGFKVQGLHGKFTARFRSHRRAVLAPELLPPAGRLPAYF